MKILFYLCINHATNRGKAVLYLVDNSVTVEQPDRNYKIAWQKLTQKYLPKTSPSYIKFNKEFGNRTLGDASTPPDEWLSELENLTNQMNATSTPSKLDVTEKDLIIRILCNHLEEYNAAVAELEKGIQFQSTSLAMENVRRVLDSRLDKKDFAALAKKQYKGVCGKYGEYIRFLTTVNTTTYFSLSRVPMAPTSQVTPITILPETNLAPTRSATDATDTVIIAGNIKPKRRVNASWATKRSVATQSPRKKKAILRKRTKVFNQIMKMLMRLTL